MERLTRIDVAQPRDDALIQQGSLERRPLAGARARQGCRIEVVRQRFGAERAQRRVVLQLTGADKVHHAEAPRVIEHDRSS